MGPSKPCGFAGRWRWPGCPQALSSASLHNALPGPLQAVLNVLDLNAFGKNPAWCGVHSPSDKCCTPRKPRRKGAAHSVPISPPGLRYNSLSPRRAFEHAIPMAWRVYLGLQCHLQLNAGTQGRRPWPRPTVELAQQVETPQWILCLLLLL